MANTKIIKEIPYDFDPYLWMCNSCGKERQYTDEKVDKTKKPYLDPQNHPYDFYIECPFCKVGIMEPPERIFFSGAFDNFKES